jgi:N-acetylmuramoyl-L-alanine amidase
VAKVPFAYQFGLQIRRIVIDAGHGGHDPGAIGIKKIREKDITLAIAKKLAASLRKRLKLETVLTRDDDTFIQLEGRPGIARARRGDLFISIHANSAPTAQAYGIETYHLDFTSDRSAILVAARENASSEKGVSEQESILRDLVLTSKKNDSIQLARAVQSSMIGGLSKNYQGVKNLGVKGAPFVVLIGANIPAILVEVGFVSNPKEAGRLRDGKYTDRLVDSVVTGVDQYIKNLKATTF